MVQGRARNLNQLAMKRFYFFDLGVIISSNKETGKTSERIDRDLVFIVLIALVLTQLQNVLFGVELLENLPRDMRLQ
jgi:hypothetical protein